MQDPRPGARPQIRLLLICAPILFEGMSLSSINVQLASIQRAWAVPPSQLQLVASVFLITYAGLLLIGGRCADQWGRRRMFLIGVTAFGIASLGATVAQDPSQLIAARALQGGGAALTSPAAVALLVADFPAGAARNRALGVFSAMGAVGFSLGVVGAGVLTQVLGWRGPFILYSGLSLAVICTAPRMLTRDTAQARQPGPVPWLPALLVTSGLIALVYAVGRVGSAAPASIAEVAVLGAGLLIVFLITQFRAQQPILPPGLLADRRMSAACIALGAGFAGISGALFLVATYYQERLGYSALAAGLAFLPQGIAVGALSPLAGRLANRWSPWRLLLTGLGILAMGQFLYLTAGHAGYVTHLFPATLLVGSGIAMMYPAATILVSQAAGPGAQGTASAILTTCQQAGGAIGIAAITGVQVIAGSSAAQLPGLWGCAGFATAALAGGVTLSIAAGRTRDLQGEPGRPVGSARSGG